MRGSSGQSRERTKAKHASNARRFDFDDRGSRVTVRRRASHVKQQPGDIVLTHLGLSARDRRVLIVGASVIGTLFAFARGVPALLDWQRNRTAEATAQSQQASVARIGV